jgi:pimeloyl-ACP methyl ester carboxylesterase
MLALRSAVAVLVLATGGSALASDAELVSINTQRGVKEAFILIQPQKPVATVVLFAGGHGALGLESGSSMRWGAGNFLVRTRDLFAAEGLAVAVLDAPADHGSGMNAEFRMSAEHARDIADVVTYLKQKIGTPVWLAGTSMGTFSAARGAIGPAKVDGLVLTSTITRARAKWRIAHSHRDGVASMDLSRVAVPTLIMSHNRDGCEVSPAADTPKLKARLTGPDRVEVKLLDGGDPPRSEPCEAQSPHGFLGIESKAVKTIAEFVKANTK